MRVKEISNIDFWVKLRDTGQMVVDAANEELEKMAPPEIRNFNILQWTKHEGLKAPFEQTRLADADTNERMSTFSALRNLLTKNKGFLQLDGYTYWLHFKTTNVIDRRKRE